MVSAWTCIVFFQAKIDLYLSSSKQTKALALLRQLKFVETALFSGGNPYNCDQLLSSITCSSNSSDAVATDAEVILIDMLWNIRLNFDGRIDRLEYN